MKKNNMTVYTVYLDDGEFCYKIVVPAFTEEDAIKYVEGNGEVIAVKENGLQDINISYLVDTLKSDGWGQQEIDIITRALIQVGLDR